MSPLARQVIADRAERNARRGEFETRLEQVKTDLEAKGVGGRIADKVSNQAKEAFAEAMDVAGDNKGIIAGTIIVLMIWLFRNPIIALLTSLLGVESDAQEDENDDPS